MTEEACRVCLPEASAVPAEDDRAPHVGQRQGRRFRLDRIASRARERLPDPDRHMLSLSTPRADDLALDEDGARPDPRRPEVPAMFGVGKIGRASCRERV